MWATGASSNASFFGWAERYDDEGDPTLGVRERRKPKPPTRDGGATADLYFEPEPEAEGIAQGARLTAAL